MARHYLGIDSSTQSLSAVVIDLDAREIIYDAGLNFDQDLPAYGTTNGVLRGDDPAVVHSPPLMWVEALDLLLEKMKQDGVDLGAIEAISGSGQQHGTVYLNQHAKKALESLDPAKSLIENLGGIFTRATSPIWMDSSTSKACGNIRSVLGGMQATTEATGSNTFERFSGPQIRKFHVEEENAYDATSHIALVSSFMASILAGGIAPIDHGDGAGMNLMDIRKRAWHPDALEATAPGLAKRLPPLAAPDSCHGKLAPYFVKKYGFSAGTKLVTWSGDNPCSVVGVGLVEPGMVAISLGTSDTYFGTMAECRTDPNGEGHVFGSPTGDYMTLICFKNGSLAREAVKDAHGLDWDGFSNALQDTPPGNEGKLLLPWFEPEIVPRVLEPGVHRRGLDEGDAAGNCRAVVEAQMMSMRLHSAWMGIRPASIYATGGASANREILQVMANVQGCPVYQLETTNSAALGAALRAVHATSEGLSWRDCVAGFTDPVTDSRIDPDPATAPVYDELTARYQAFENECREAK